MKRLRPEQIALYLAGILLCASGVVHVMVWLSDGGSLAGPVSWRKPILFGFSSGVTLISIAWILGTLPRRWSDRIVYPMFSLAMLVEVALITLQQWRGVPSHYNRSTPFDAAILNWIEGLILLITLVIVHLTWRSFGTVNCPRVTTLAIRSGLVLLIVACGIGFAVAFIGTDFARQNLPPEVYPPAGVMKFPHGVPIHAIQFFPITAWLLQKLGIDERLRYQSIWWAIIAATAFTLFSIMQTFTGRARFDFWWPSAAVLAVAIGSLFYPATLAWKAVYCKASESLSFWTDRKA